MNNLIVSPAPHVHTSNTVTKTMLNVIIALLPAFVVGVIYFGVGALIVTGISIASCVLFEYLISRLLLKKPSTIGDLSAVVTGLLLAFNLPSNLPWWIIVIGALVAIGIGKMTFGGLGNNPFNPALVGRVFLLISFPVQMTTWPVPQGFATKYIDAVTAATPLSAFNEGAADMPSHLELLFGQVGGSFGEVSALALIIGGIYLLVRKVITWHIPVSIILTVALFSCILWLCNDSYMDPCTHLLAGGLMLGAIFMATDYATSPMTPMGQLIYGVLIGIIVVVIRTWGAYPEGMSFAILIMNAVTPLLNHYCRPRRFGENPKK